MSEVEALIGTLGLQPHPEGGYFRETWRSGVTLPGGRASATAILFLLDAGQRSHWHKVDAAELWLFHAGSPIRLDLAATGQGPIRTVRLGPGVLAGEQPQCLVAAGEWQAAQADRGWALMSCLVSPGFDFAGFTLAPPGWKPG